MFGKQASRFNQISSSTAGRMIASMAVDAYLCTASAYIYATLTSERQSLDEYKVHAEVGENVCRKNANYLLAVLPFSAEKEQGDDA